MKELTEKRSIDTITTEILFYKQQAGVTILEIGKRLIEAKEQLEHGEWLDWLEHRGDTSVRTAQNLMRLSKEYGNTKSISYLGVTKALALLAVPAEEREQFAEEVHAEGLSVRELKKAIQERDEAIKKKEQELIVNRQYLDDEMERADTLQKEKEELLRQIEGLANRPVEVATVDATEEQLREAEQRGMEHNKWELDVAKRQLGEQVAKTNRLQQRLDEKQQELKRLKEDAAEASDDTRINQTLGEINAWARELQEAHRRITELLGNLDDLSRTRVQELRRKLLRRMLEEIK